MFMKKLWLLTSLFTIGGISTAFAGPLEGNALKNYCRAQAIPIAEKESAIEAEVSATHTKIWHELRNVVGALKSLNPKQKKTLEEWYSGKSKLSEEALNQELAPFWTQLEQIQKLHKNEDSYLVKPFIGQKKKNRGGHYIGCAWDRSIVERASCGNKPGELLGCAKIDFAKFFSGEEITEESIRAQVKQDLRVFTKVSPRTAFACKDAEKSKGLKAALATNLPKACGKEIDTLDKSLGSSTAPQVIVDTTEPGSKKNTAPNDKSVNKKNSGAGKTVE
jgi:hypothetical protein